MPSLLNSEPRFEETQWFCRRWWWLLLGITIALSGLLSWVFGKPHGSTALLIAIPLTVLVLGSLWLLKLTVRVDKAGIHYQYIPFLNRWRHWPWQEFRRVAPRTYSPLGDYGGWGIKGWPSNWVYNVWGPAGLQLVFRSGDKLLLGTQQPAELQAVLAALHAADATLPIELATQA
jgi:hypothetical protein